MQMYSALIRTYNSAATIGSLLQSLLRVEPPPRKIIVVDSGSTDETIALCRDFGCSVHTYDGAAFSYGRSLNQGFSLIEEPYCLVISSHVEILRSDLPRRMLDAFEDPAVKASYIDFTKGKYSETRNTIANFNGKNGVWNPCAMYSVEAVKSLTFDESLPAAEDQHLALRLFKLGFATVELGGPWIRYRNPYTSPRKQNDAQVAIAYFVWPDYLRLGNISRRIGQSVKVLMKGEWTECKRLICLSARLFLARYCEPRFEQANLRNSARASTRNRVKS